MVILRSFACDEQKINRLLKIIGKIFKESDKIFSWKCRLLECITILLNLCNIRKRLTINSLYQARTRLVVDKISLISTKTQLNQLDTNGRVKRAL